MGIFQRFEKGVEGAVSGVFARAFKGDVQPVEIAARLQRELDAEAKLMSRDKKLVPNDFTVELSQHDHDKLAPYAATLTRELGDELRSHAGRPRLRLQRPDPHRPRPRHAAADRALHRLLRGRRRRLRTDRARRRGRPPPPPGRTSTPPDRPAERPQARRARAGPRGQRHAAPAAGRPAWSSAAAPRPTCASTTPASPGGTPRSGSARAPTAASTSSTSARPTASPSTARRCGTRCSGRVRGSRSGPPGCSSTTRPPAEASPVSEIAVTVVKVLFLALLWLFILSAVSVVRSDLFGRTVAADDGPPELESPRPPTRKVRRQRGAPRVADHHPGPADR